MPVQSTVHVFLQWFHSFHNINSIKFTPGGRKALVSGQMRADVLSVEGFVVFGNRSGRTRRFFDAIMIVMLGCGIGCSV